MSGYKSIRRPSSLGGRSAQPVPVRRPIPVRIGIHIRADTNWEARCEDPECRWVSEACGDRDDAVAARISHLSEAHQIDLTEDGLR